MSSTEEGPQVQMQRDTRPSSPGYGRLIAPAVIAIVIIILILQNTKEDWRIHFFFWWFSLPAALMLVLLLLRGVPHRPGGERAGPSAPAGAATRRLLSQSRPAALSGSAEA